jgi:spermidine synthase
MDLAGLVHLGRELHRRYDEFGPLLVFDDGNKRYLSFGTADEQSCQLKSAPTVLQHEYARAMAAVLIQFPDAMPPQQITLLGTGAGTLATALHQQLPGSQIQAVDVRAAVFLLAHQYFALPRTPAITTHTADAGAFLRDSEPGLSDLLICDLYLADGLDPLVLQADFLQACARHLSKRGWLVLNLWKEHREQSDCLNVLKTLFPQLLHSTTQDGNWVIWASRESLLLSRNDARARCKQLSPQYGYNLWNASKGFYRHT